MSIIERALQKTQQRGKSATGAVPTLESQDGTAGRSPPAPPVVSLTDRRPSLEDPSLTARDLKAIVEINFDRMRELGRMPPLAAQRRTDEELRRIKWPLLSAIAARAPATPVRNNAILVTSSVPAEGKSFMALNLALNIARDQDMRVILVDGDVARPTLTPALGLEDREGLNDVLADTSMDINDVVYRTSVDGLFFVPAGKWHDESPEHFAGTRMEQLVAELSHRVGKGIVLVDSPPLLATNEAQVATRYVGQVLLVVRADSTEHGAVRDALALVEKSTPVSAVLNCVEHSWLGKYYGQYYYGYGSEEGQEYGRADRSAKEAG